MGDIMEQMGTVKFVCRLAMMLLRAGLFLLGPLSASIFIVNIVLKSNPPDQYYFLDRSFWLTMAMTYFIYEMVYRIVRQDTYFYLKEYKNHLLRHNSVYLKIPCDCGWNWNDKSTQQECHKLFNWINGSPQVVREACKGCQNINFVGDDGYCFGCKQKLWRGEDPAKRT